MLLMCKFLPDKIFSKKIFIFHPYLNGVGVNEGHFWHLISLLSRYSLRKKCRTRFVIFTKHNFPNLEETIINANKLYKADFQIKHSETKTSKVELVRLYCSFLLTLHFYYLPVISLHLSECILGLEAAFRSTGQAKDIIVDTSVLNYSTLVFSWITSLGLRNSYVLMHVSATEITSLRISSNKMARLEWLELIIIRLLNKLHYLFVSLPIISTSKVATLSMQQRNPEAKIITLFPATSINSVDSYMPWNMRQNAIISIIELKYCKQYNSLVDSVYFTSQKLDFSNPIEFNLCLNFEFNASNLTTMQEIYDYITKHCPLASVYIFNHSYISKTVSLEDNLLLRNKSNAKANLIINIHINISCEKLEQILTNAKIGIHTYNLDLFSHHVVNYMAAGLFIISSHKSAALSDVMASVSKSEAKELLTTFSNSDSIHEIKQLILISQFAKTYASENELIKSLLMAFSPEYQSEQKKLRFLSRCCYEISKHRFDTIESQCLKILQLWQLVKN